MLFKIFFYFLYIMNLSIYIVVACYVSKGNLAQVVNPLNSKKMEHCSACTVARWRGHCSGSDPRWPHDISREIVYLSPNHRFLARNTKISPDRYFSMKYRVETLRYTIFRRYIAEISRYFPPWISMSKRKNHYTLFDLSCQFFFLKQNENSMVVDGRIWRE